VSKALTCRISVSFPYNQEHIAKVKTIPGHRWYIRNASTAPSWEYICNADMNELSANPVKGIEQWKKSNPTAKNLLLSLSDE
jgi:hypothetical protein